MGMITLRDLEELTFSVYFDDEELYLVKDIGNNRVLVNMETKRCYLTKVGIEDPAFWVEFPIEDIIGLHYLLGLLSGGRRIVSNIANPG